LNSTSAIKVTILKNTDDSVLKGSHLVLSPNQQFLQSNEHNGGLW